MNMSAAFIPCCLGITLPSVLWCCWLGNRKGIRPVKNWVVGCWHGYLSGARCRLAYGPADATATHSSCFSKIQIGFTFLVPAALDSPRQRAVKWICVCVCCLGITMHSRLCDTRRHAWTVGNTGVWATKWTFVWLCWHVFTCHSVDVGSSNSLIIEHSDYHSY